MKTFPLMKTVPKIILNFLRYDPNKQIRPFSLSFDVTSKCNLRCKHCYIYREENKRRELNKTPKQEHDGIFSLVERVKKDNPGIIHATWVGGEPLMPVVAEPLTRRLTKLFPLNWVVTNGTFSIPEDYNTMSSLTTFVVSLDGPEEYHDEIRGEGVFRKVMDNVENTDARVYSHFVINSINKDGIEDLICKLQNETKVRGVRFSFHTPEKNLEDSLWLKDYEKDKVVEKIHFLKRVYGDFIWMSDSEIEAFYSNQSKKVFGENCLILKGGTLCMDYKGDEKECVMGPNADC